MEEDVRGVRKIFCHVKKDVFLLDRDFFHVKKCPGTRISELSWGAGKTLKPRADKGFESFWGASSRGRERFHSEAERRLPGVGLSRHTRTAFPRRLSC